jgi:hypothetical protein
VKAERTIQLTLTWEEAQKLRDFTCDFDGTEEHRLGSGLSIDVLVCGALSDQLGVDVIDDEEDSNE